jgi:hypothetical protein
MRKFFRSRGHCRIALVAGLIAAVLTATQSRAGAASFSYLDAAQLAQLRTLPIPLLLPRRLPAGYRLSHFKAKRYPFTGSGPSAAGGTYELDFAGSAGRDILLIVSDGGLGDPPDYNDTSRRSFDAAVPGFGRVHFDPMKYDSGPYWYGQRLRVDRPAAAHAVFLTITGSADPTALRAFCAAIAPLPK